MANMKFLKLIFILGLFITACANEENILRKSAIQLCQSVHTINEHKYAVDLNNISRREHIPYSIEINRNADNERISVSDVLKYADEKLEVVIYPKGKKWSVTWAPVDNKNILVLLRE